MKWTRDGTVIQQSIYSYDSGIYNHGVDGSIEYDKLYVRSSTGRTQHIMLHYFWEYGVHLLHSVYLRKAAAFSFFQDCNGYYWSATETKCWKMQCKKFVLVPPTVRSFSIAIAWIKAMVKLTKTGKHVIIIFLNEKVRSTNYRVCMHHGMINHLLYLCRANQLP